MECWSSVLAPSRGCLGQSSRPVVFLAVRKDSVFCWPFHGTLPIAWSQIGHYRGTWKLEAVICRGYRSNLDPPHPLPQSVVYEGPGSRVQSPATRGSSQAAMAFESEPWPVGFLTLKKQQLNCAVAETVSLVRFRGTCNPLAETREREEAMPHGDVS